MSVVRIETTLRTPAAGRQSPDDSPRTSIPSGGTGIVIAPGGIILTNAHVVSNTDRIHVRCADGVLQAARIVAVHAELDLAVVRIDRRDLPPLRPAQDTAPVGLPVVAIGPDPAGADGGCPFGIVTSATASLQDQLDPTRRRDYSHLVESTVPVEPGFSGGPLLDSRGALIGVNVAAVGPTGQHSARAYAIPLDARTRQAIEDLTSRISLDPPRRSAPAWGG